MKMRPADVVLLLLPLVKASSSSAYTSSQVFCQTSRGPKPISKVPTFSTTKFGATDTLAIYLTSTETYSTNTWISVVGKNTTTVPVGPHFTALVNAPTSTVVEPSLYPTRVDCLAFVTTLTGQVKTTTYTQTSLVFASTTITSHVPTSTAYAACSISPRRPPGYEGPSPDHPSPPDQGPNIRHDFRGRPILDDSYSGSNVQPGANDVTDGVNGLDAVTCCEYTQKKKAAGFYHVVYGDGTGYCAVYPDAWGFATFDGMDHDPSLGSLRYGNGPAGKATFLKYVPS